MNLDRATWRKSSYGGEGQPNCVEIAAVAGSAGVRDSKDPGPTLVLPPATWHAFLTDIRIR